MAQELNRDDWEPARLIPVSGIRNAEEQEQRATSALLAVLSAVNEFGVAITKPYGAPKGTLQTFIETPFELEDGRKVRPDGLIEIRRGKRSWSALVEVKTGSNCLNREQIEAYLDLAKEQNFDCVLTISNEIARIPGQHPVEVDKRKIRKVALHHLSWSRVLTEAILQKSHRGVADADQAWILEELIRYLNHHRAGAVDFRDMGDQWVGVRDAVKHGTLRHSDKHAVEVAGKWEELITFASLRLSRQLGANVQEVLSAKEKGDLSIRIDSVVDEMVSKGMMSGKLRIPNAVGDTVICADLRGQQVVASVSVSAPKSGRSTTRINWLLRQLKSSPDDVRIDSWGLRSRTSMSDLLGNVRHKQELLVPTDKRDIVQFTLSLSRPMGLKRSTGLRSFIDSVLDTLDEFYRDVVQDLREWQPPAPKLQAEKPEDNVKEKLETEAAPQVDGSGNGESNGQHKGDAASGDHEAVAGSESPVGRPGDVAS